MSSHVKSPGQIASEKSRARLDQFQFYVDSLTNIERSKLAARYLRKVPPRYRLDLLKRLTISQLALCEVCSWETYGW